MVVCAQNSGFLSRMPSFHQVLVIYCDNMCQDVSLVIFFCFAMFFIKIIFCLPNRVIPSESTYKQSITSIFL